MPHEEIAQSTTRTCAKTTFTPKQREPPHLDAREHTRRAGIAPVEEKSGLLEEEDEEDEDGDLNEWPEEWEDVDGSAAS